MTNMTVGKYKHFLLSMYHFTLTYGVMLVVVSFFMNIQSDIILLFPLCTTKDVRAQCIKSSWSCLLYYAFMGEKLKECNILHTIYRNHNYKIY